LGGIGIAYATIPIKLQLPGLVPISIELAPEVDGFVGNIMSPTDSDIAVSAHGLKMWALVNVRNG